MKKWSESKWFGLADREYKSNQKGILKVTECINGGRLLDIGCNDGLFTLKVAKHIDADEIYGIEIDKEVAKLAKRRGIVVKICDANNKFPFEDSFFDTVISNQVLEHIIATDNFFREIHRVLKPNGYAIISTPNLASLHNLFLLLLGMQPISLHISEIQVGNFLYGTKTHGHVKIFTIPALKDLARYHGFKVEKTFGFGFYPFPYPLSKILAKIFKRHCVFIGLKMRK